MNDENKSLWFMLLSSIHGVEIMVLQKGSSLDSSWWKYLRGVEKGDGSVPVSLVFDHLSKVVENGRDTLI